MNLELWSLVQAPEQIPSVIGGNWREGVPKRTGSPVVWQVSRGWSQRVAAALLTTDKGYQLLQAGGKPRERLMTWAQLSVLLKNT